MVALDEGEKFMGQSLIRRTWLAIAEDLVITVSIFVMKFCFGCLENIYKIYKFVDVYVICSL